MTAPAPAKAPPSGIPDLSVVWDGYELNPGFTDSAGTVSNSVTSVTGWYDTPAAEGHDDTLVLADGGVYGPKTLDPRAIVIAGAAAGPWRSILPVRDAIAGLANGRQPVTLVITDTAAARQATVRSDTDQFTWAFIAGTGNTAATWQISATANDVLLYGTVLQTVMLTTDEDAGGGRTYPRSYPWAYAGTQLPGNEAVAGNQGNVPAPVTATWTGPLSQTRLTSTADDLSQNNGIVMAALDDGQQVTVQLGTMTSASPAMIGAGSVPMILPPGQTTWTLVGTGTGNVTLTWRPAWV